MIDKGKIENGLFFFALLLILLGGIGFFRGVNISLHTNSLGKTYSKLPLRELAGIIVDRTGKIYCISTFYSRVQVYDQTGHFIYGLKIPTNGGILDIFFDENQNLNVQTVRSNTLYIFDNNGNLITQKDNAEYVDLHSRLEFIDNSYNQFMVKNHVLFSQIIKITPDGKKKTIVFNTLLDWILVEPFLSWILFAVGMIIIFILLDLPSILIDAHKKRMEHSRTKKPIIEV